MKNQPLFPWFARAGVAVSCSALAACVIHLSDSGLNLHGASFDPFDHRADREETHALELVPGRPLTLIGTAGDIRVTATDDGRSELKARIRGHGRTQEEALALVERYSVEIVNDDAGTTVRLKGEPLDISDRSMRASITADVDFDAFVPHWTPIQASASSGDIRVKGPVGRSQLDTSYGDVEAENVRGGLEAHCGSGDVSAADLDEGDVTLQSGYGDISLERAGGRHVECTSGSGDLEITDLRAETLALSTSYGDVRASQVAGDLQARSGTGDVRVSGLEGPLEAESSYGQIEIEGVLAELTARTGSGNVRVRAQPGSRIESGWSLSSSYGNVSLHVPEGFGCELDARTSYGSVDSDFSLLFEAGQRQDDSTLSGRIGNGGGTVRLTSGSGNVSLKRY